MGGSGARMRDHTLVLVRSMAGMVEDKTAEQPTVRATRRRKYDNYPNYYAK